MKLVIGCDPNAKALKDVIIEHCKGKGLSVEDFGSDDPIYANTAIHVAHAVAQGIFDRGILLCGTGIGMSIAANKVKGAYAALITDAYASERAQKSNCANIACFGAFTQGKNSVLFLLDIWLNSFFEPGCPSEVKVQRIKDYEA